MTSGDIALNIINNYKRTGKQPDIFYLKHIQLGKFNLRRLKKVKKLTSKMETNKIFLSDKNSKRRVCYLSQAQDFASYHSLAINIDFGKVILYKNNQFKITGPKNI